MIRVRSARLAVPVVIGGVVGARVYHLFTGYDWLKGGIVGTVQIWRGGLSIWGAVLGGLVVLVVVARRRDLDLLALMDAIAPAVLIGQGIGASGTTSTKSCSAGLRGCRGVWRSMSLTAPPATRNTRRSTRPSCTSRCGVSSCSGSSSSPNGESGFAKAKRSRCMSACTHSVALCSKRSVSTKRPACFGIRFNLLVSAALCIGGAVWFVVLACRSPPGREEGDATPRVTAGDQSRREEYP